MDILPTVPSLYEAALSAVLAVFVFTPLFIWMKRKFLRHHRLIIETTIEEGQTTREYGFAEPGIKVRLVNAGGYRRRNPRCTAHFREELRVAVAC